MAPIIVLRPGWTAAERQTLIRLFKDLQARNAADLWEECLTDHGDPQFYVFHDGTPDALLAISRIVERGRRLYLVANGQGHALVTDPDLDRAIHARAAASRPARDGMLRLSVGMLALKAAEMLALNCAEIHVDEVLLWLQTSANAAGMLLA